MAVPAFSTSRALASLGATLLVAACAGGGESDTDATDAALDVADGGDADATPGDWQAFEPAFDAAEYGAFMSVWARDPGDVWTVGGQPAIGDGSGDAVAFHNDGQAWSRIDVPSGGMINWVHGTATSTWMAGERGRVLRVVGTEVVDTFDLPTEAALWGIFAVSDSAVWTVGGDPRSPAGVPVIFRFDGTGWSEETVPDMGTHAANSLFKVWGAPDGRLFAVGARGLILASAGDGAWELLESGTSEDLISLWGRGSDDVVVVGGRARGVLGRFDGATWDFRGLDRVSGVNGSWMAADGTVLVDGSGGRVLRVAPDSWDYEDVPTSTGDVLHGIFALDGGPAWAVGGTLMSPVPFEGVVLVAD